MAVSSAETANNVAIKIETMKLEDRKKRQTSLNKLRVFSNQLRILSKSKLTSKFSFLDFGFSFNFKWETDENLSKTTS